MKCHVYPYQSISSQKLVKSITVKRTYQSHFNFSCKLIAIGEIIFAVGTRMFYFTLWWYIWTNDVLEDWGAALRKLIRINFKDQSPSKSLTMSCFSYLSRHLSNYTMSDHNFPDFSLLSFLNWKWNAGTRELVQNQTKVCKQAKRRNLRYYNINRDEIPQRGNEMDCPSFDGFHAQSGCKLTYANKNQIQLSLV